MNAIPKIYNARQVDPSGQYDCQLCKVQKTGDKVDGGWVACPMIGDAFIGLGCCIAIQKVARSEKFDHHPYRDLFDPVSEYTGLKVAEVRDTCLEHQKGIISARLSDNNIQERIELNDLLNQIETLGLD